MSSLLQCIVVVVVVVIIIIIICILFALPQASLWSV
jgi:hypothetical protein